MTEVGRNDPCPCGSGKKFKKCCAQKSFMQRKAISQINVPSGHSLGHITGMVAKTLRAASPEEPKSLKDKVTKETPKKET